MSGATRTDVSVVITNYNTGPFLGPCVDSVLAQDLGDLKLEVIIVENASFLDQRSYLEQAERRGARVLRLGENHGHGGGCNRGFRASSGRFVFLINSDIVACPGAMAPLVRHLETHADAGFVEPQTYLDDDRAFLIPEILRPSPWEYTLAAIARLSGRCAARLGLRHLRRSLATWRANEPFEVEHLTGAFLGARRDVLAALGGYDEGYPLYYEDSDLFARARRAGWKLVLVPQSKVIHYGHRSVAMIWDEAMAKSRIGRARYMRLHHGRLGRWWDAWLEAFVGVARRLHEARPHPAPIDLGTLDGPPRLELSGQARPYLFEIAFDPFFLLSCGRLGQEAPPKISGATWRSLFPTTYYLRALDLDTWKPVAVWTFEKAS